MTARQRQRAEAPETVIAGFAPEDATRRAAVQPTAEDLAALYAQRATDAHGRLAPQSRALVEKLAAHAASEAASAETKTEE